MLKDISLIKNKSVNFIKQFICNCSIEEKIDTHYIIVEITSKQNITIKKASGKHIDRIDMILNDMYGQLITDWNYIRLANQDLFKKYIGYNISLFYFPNNKPLNTEYKKNIRYVIDRFTYNNENKNINEFLSKLLLKDEFNIIFKHNLNKKTDSIDIEKITEKNKDTIDYKTLFLSIIDKNDLLAVNDPEGYVLKYKNNIYQITLSEQPQIINEKTQYEYVLCDFINYCKQTNYITKITNNYIKTVTQLFNDYIINWESKYHNIEHNVDIASIQPPTIGTMFDIGYEYIPDNITIKLCKNELYKSIFRILLANLRKSRDYKYSIFMNNKQVDNWNLIYKNIKIRSQI